MFYFVSYSVRLCHQVSQTLSLSHSDFFSLSVSLFSSSVSLFSSSVSLFSSSVRLSQFEKLKSRYPTWTQENDNARALTRVRFAVANIGDESMSCPDTRANYDQWCADRYRCSTTLDTIYCKIFINISIFFLFFWLYNHLLSNKIERFTVLQNWEVL